MPPQVQLSEREKKLLALIQKQDRLLYICFYMLLNLAEDTQVEKKMKKKVRAGDKGTEKDKEKTKKKVRAGRQGGEGQVAGGVGGCENTFEGLRAGGAVAGEGWGGRGWAGEGAIAGKGQEGWTVAGAEQWRGPRRAGGVGLGVVLD